MSVLVLRALGVGDLATAVPALRGLRAAYPGERITLAVPRWLAPLVPLTGAVDSVLPLPGLDAVPADLAPGTVRPGTAPELAVNLHGRGPQSHLLLRRWRPGRLLAFACTDAGFTDGPQWRADEHEVRRWCRMLAWYGITCDPNDLAMRVPAAPPPVAGATVLHPGAKDAQRRWPGERFAAVAHSLTAAGHHVVVTGSGAERALAGSVAHGAGLPDERILAGRTDVAGLAALVAAARLVICGDTGTAHLATAYGTPSVVLFGPTPPARWGPPPDRPRHAVLWRGDLIRTAATDPARPHRALAAITPTEVLRAVDTVDGLTVPGRPTRGTGMSPTRYDHSGGTAHA